MRRHLCAVLLFSGGVVACSGSAVNPPESDAGSTFDAGLVTPIPDGGSAATDGGSQATDGGAPQLLADRYPGDVNIASDPAVVWAENFEAATVADVAARYEEAKGQSGMALEQDTPASSTGQRSMRLTASGAGPNAVDLFKNLAPGYDELYVRYYVKYQGGAPWHHSGVWIGGYNPPTNWPNPQAGTKPTGSDRFSIAFEPIEDGTNVRMDFYNYWMNMHSWMAQPSGNTAYYGNTLLHDTSVRAPDDTWFCVEYHVKLNPDPSSRMGAELALWMNDQLVQRFTDSAPLGYWVRDKFCPDAADGTECTDYRPANPTLVPLDLQFRTTSDLKISHFWPQNYVSAGGPSSLWFDDMVLATERVGCLR